VSPAWVAERLGRPELVLLHVGDRSEYEGAHLPGAQPIAVADVSLDRDGLTLEIPPVERLKAAFEKVGVTNDSLIVLYFGRDQLAATGRLFLTLDYLGLGDRTAVLDGGLPAWRAEGYPITATMWPAEAGSMTPRPRPEVIADVSTVRANLNDPSIAILDARTPDYYSGENDGRGRYARPGHIAGAGNIPFSSLVDDRRRFKDAAALRAQFVAAGADAGDGVIAYCHIGQQGSLLYFVARFLGYDVRLYDGSFTEWSANAELPVEKGRK
jgi:thiosulfate/3-mercaptopyruvate sulfurtransferase